MVLDTNTSRTALRLAENLGHEEVACILRVDPAVSTIQEAAAAGSVQEVWALMRQVRPCTMAMRSLPSSARYVSIRFFSLVGRYVLTAVWANLVRTRFVAFAHCTVASHRFTLLWPFPTQTPPLTLPDSFSGMCIVIDTCGGSVRFCRVYLATRRA